MVYKVNWPADLYEPLGGLSLPKNTGDSGDSARRNVSVGLGCGAAKQPTAGPLPKVVPGVTTSDILRIFPGSRVVSGMKGEPDEEAQLSLFGEVSILKED